MPIYRLQKFGEWKKLAAIYRLQKFGEWKKLSAIYRLQKFGEWKKVFGGISIIIPSIEQRVTISGQTDSEGFVTLTGTNYHWNDATSLTYFFQWSSDGGSSWSTINTGSIANPSTGSSNTKTYMVLQDDVLGNLDNLYRFRVNAENANASNDSISENNITINAPRNIVISYFSRTSNSITVEFDTPLYSSSYQIKIGTSTFQSVAGTVVGGKTRVTATGLSPSTSYSIQVRGFTGILGSVFGTAYNKGYSGNFSNTITQTTDVAPAPVQITAPTKPGGTGEALNSISIGTTGTYNNQQSKTTSLVAVLDTVNPTNGSTTAEGTVVASSYTVTQEDATIPKNKFYTRDDVVGLDGNTYYYYSPALITFLGIITDTYTRTRTPPLGLGMASSGYIYNSYDINAVSWTVNGSFAVSSVSVPAGTTSSSNFAMDTFETNSANISVSMGMTTGSLAGYGASVWVTSASNWWAVISTYDAVAYSQTVCKTKYCSGSASCCPSSGLCASCTYVDQQCTGTASTSTNINADPGCLGFANSCSGCTFTGTTTTYTYSTRSESISYSYQPWELVNTVTYQPWVSSTSNGYSVVVNIGGTIFCESGYASTDCPNPECGVNGCAPTLANVGKRCSACTPTTTWTCGSSTTVDGTSCPPQSTIGAPNTRCTSDCTSGTRWNCGATTSGSSCPPYSATGASGTRCSVANCTSTTTYPCTGSATTSDCPPLGSGNGGRCSDCTTNTSYNWSYSVYENRYSYGQNETESGFTYNTRLQLVSSASGTVSYPTWNTPNENGIIKSVNVAGTLNNNNFVRATGLYVVASGDTITAEGSNANNDTFTQLVKTTSGVTKTEPDGSSSAGIIKGYTASLSSEGGVDNLTIQ